MTLCKFCKKTFLLVTMGLKAVESHMKGGQYQRYMAAASHSGTRLIPALFVAWPKFRCHLSVGYEKFHFTARDRKGRGTVGCPYCDEVSNVTIVFEIACYYCIQVTVYVHFDSLSDNNTLAQNLRSVTVGSCCWCLNMPTCDFMGCCSDGWVNLANSC